MLRLRWGFVCLLVACPAKCLAGAGAVPQRSHSCAHTVLCNPDMLSFPRT